MSSAIVTGATGILGREIVSALSKDSRWKTVHALSRSQKEKYASKVKHDTIDLTGDAKQMAKQLEGVEAEYVFFTAYLAKDDEGEACKVNGTKPRERGRRNMKKITDAPSGAMLQNFLDALTITGADKKMKRLILTTGAKQYGVHLGPPKNPMEETDPRFEGPNRPPNFYYVQQDILKKAAQGKGWDWVVTYPNDVIGVAKGNFMNLSTAVGLYVAISKELGGDLVFPGSEEFYQYFDSFTYSRLNAQFNLWAAFEPKASNEAFNVVNGDVTSWQTLWPKIAERYGCKIPADQFSGPAPDSSEMKLPTRPPLEDFAEKMGLKNHVPQGLVRQRIDLTKWSQKPEVKRAWEKLAARDGLDNDAFEKATWGFLGFVLGRNYNLVISMSKARKLGWTGYVDSWDALEECLQELEDEKILPRHK
ncbi:MAG: hypothetical protein M4579_003992 [Chaenotheca gracillima]|nr:MAG: hypothetical protein M4579_003992 [Chaenotheca gracillima]